VVSEGLVEYLERGGETTAPPRAPADTELLDRSNLQTARRAYAEARRKSRRWPAAMAETAVLVG